jgi:hypothetical protein
MHQSTRTVMTGRSSHYWVRLPLFVGLDAQSCLVPYVFERSRVQRTRLVSSACLASDRMGKRSRRHLFHLAFLWLLFEANASSRSIRLNTSAA